MSEIELDCPNCREHLVLDQAFAGGVCRCSSCGTLMSVPKADELGNAQRRAAPSARPEVPAGTKSSIKRKRRRMEDEISREAQSEQRRAEETPDANALDTGEITDEPIDDRESSDQHAVIVTATDDGTFVTPSGRTISVSSGSKIPTAKKQQQRNAIINIVGMFILLATMAAVMGIAFFAVQYLSRESNSNGSTSGGSQAPSANPFQSETANVLHVPITSPSVVLVDGYSMANHWSANVKPAFVASAKTFGVSRVQFIFFTDARPTVFPPQAEVLKSTHRQELKSILEIGVFSPRVANPLSALETSLNSKPRQVILCTSQKMDKSILESIDEQITKSNVRFDVVLIDTTDTALKRLAEKHNGTYLTVTEQQIVIWLRAQATENTK